MRNLESKYLRVCVYLRKSREDIEAEKKGEGETLAKHRKILMKFAQENGINIIKIYEELASGESLVLRPYMVQLLKDIEEGLYDAVLVMDIDRLGRGDMEEQGLILKTFKNSKTKIITPRKVYDLDDEFDEEYSEFEAFMARKELKIINRRLQRGRIRSIEDGNYLGTTAPYGYKFEYDGKDRLLVIDVDKAEVIKTIFNMYIAGCGASKIANALNSMGYKSATGISWKSYSVLNAIKNPIYAGFVTWKKVYHDKIKNERKLQPKSEWIIAKGKHEPIITTEIYQMAKEILEKRYHVPYQTKMTNPLSGLIRCGNCGASMILRPYKNTDDQVMCYANCGNKSSKFKYIEARLLEQLSSWLEKQQRTFSLEDKNNNTDLEISKKQLYSIENELKELEKQKNILHDLLERGIYDVDTFMERSSLIASRIENLKLEQVRIETLIADEENFINTKDNLIPRIQTALEIYKKSNNAYDKNQIMKSIIDRIEYKKEKKQRNDEFTIDIYPKVDFIDKPLG